MQTLFESSHLKSAVRFILNQEEDEARALIDADNAANPTDPLGFAFGAALSFYSLAGTWALSRGDGFSTASFIGGQRMPIPGTQEREILEMLQTADANSRAILEGASGHDRALFALCVTQCVRRDYHALVQNAWKTSFHHAQEANLLGRQLLKSNANAHDAYFVFGLNEILVSQVPAALRLIARIPGIAGTKAKAIQFCEVTAKSGYYCQDIARCILAALYTQEGRAAESLRMLRELNQDVPRNVIIREELRIRNALASIEKRDL